MRQYYLTISILLFLFCDTPVVAQYELEWERTFGGSLYDTGIEIHEVENGSYVCAGFSSSIDGDAGNGNGFLDYWLLKFDNLGDVVWEKSFGGSQSDILRSMKPTSDGGFILLGHTPSNDMDVSQNNGGRDFWLVKIDGNGEMEWAENYGGSSDDFGVSVIQTNDDGYLLAGSTSSNDIDVSNNFGNADGWLVKTNSNGEIEWERNFGGSGDDSISSIIKESDGFILGGQSNSTDGEVGSNNGENDIWLFKINNDGDVLWFHSYGGSETENVQSIRKSKTGGYIICANSRSSDGDISGTNFGLQDYWIVRTNNLGELEWEKNYGGSSMEFLLGIDETDDGGILCSGWTSSFDGDISTNYGGRDLWTLKLAEDGTLEWEKNYGGSNDDGAYRMTRTSDGGFLIIGYTESNDGDIGSINGENDIWILKYEPCLPDNTLSQNGTSLTANASNLSYQWLDCNNNCDPISGATTQSFEPTSDGSFAVAISDDNCTIMSDCVPFDFVSQARQIENNQILTFPNPFQDIISVKLESSTQAIVELIDTNGIIWQEHITHNNTIDINTSQLPEGLYFLKVISNDKIHLKRMVKIF